MKRILIVLLLLLISAETNSQTTGSESDYPSGKVWGLAFGDYFYKAGGDSTSSTMEYTAYKKDYNTLEFRRVFFGYNHSFNEDFTAKVVLAFEGNDVTPDGKRGVNLKDASMTWNNLFTGSALNIGLFATPAFSYHSELYWSYRSVEKTILDMRGIASSRDMGAMLYGSFDKKTDFGYMSMIGTGSGAKLETNKYKKFYALLFGNFFDKKFFIDIYSDYEPYGNDKTKTTVAGFMGYKSDKFTAGIEPFISIQKNFNVNVPTSPGNIEPLGVSFFVNGNVSKDKVKFFARYDYFNPDSRTAAYGFINHFVTAGIDIMPIPKVHFMPNLWLNAYSNKNESTAGRKSDVVPRVTFFYDYR